MLGYLVKLPFRMAAGALSVVAADVSLALGTAEVMAYAEAYVQRIEAMVEDALAHVDEDDAWW